MISEDLILDGPLVSVVIPTFNRAGTLERSIASVEDQSYRNIELLVVDDGSTDATEQMVRNHVSRLRHFTYLMRPGRNGAQSARIEGIKSAKGEYIAFL